MSNTQTDEQHLSLSTPSETISQTEPQPALPHDDTQLYGVLKCYFHTPKRGDIWGAFCFLFNGTSGAVMENVFWVTRALTSPPLDVNMGWRELNKLIPKMGAYEKTMGEKMAVSLVEVFSPSARMSVCKEGGTAEQLETLSLELRDAFERTTHYFLDLKLVFEPLQQDELQSSGVLTGSGAEEGAGLPKLEGEAKTFAGTLITCTPVIDPVHGIPVSDLKPGDMLEVKLQGGIGPSELVQKFLATNNQDAIFPIFAVERRENDKTYVLLDINEEIKGLITVTKDLRLRVLEVKPKKTLTFNLDNVILFGTFVMAFVIIIFVITRFFF